MLHTFKHKVNFVVHKISGKVGLYLISHNIITIWVFFFILTAAGMYFGVLFLMFPEQYFNLIFFSPASLTVYAVCCVLFRY